MLKCIRMFMASEKEIYKEKKVKKIEKRHGRNKER
jgi:hypothetical protein